MPIFWTSPLFAHDHLLMKDSVTCTSWTTSVSNEQIAVIRDLMKSREERLHHALWHAVRGALTASNRQTIALNYGPSWNEFHSVCPVPGADATLEVYNPAGEDFLFMHRTMIESVRAALVKARLPCIKGWDRIPTVVEAPLPDGNREGAKSEEAYRRLLSWQKYFFDPAWLRGKSLSQVGWAMEFSIHNNLHMRYATEAPPAGFEQAAEAGGAPFPLNRKFPSGWKFDDEGYNWLADPYSAALNKTFWLIHGYVDNVIDLWLAANLYGSIAISCEGKKKCYQWHQPWMGVVSEGAIARAIRESPYPPSRESTLDFTRSRMDLQRWGIIEASERPAKGMPRSVQGDNSDDPFQYLAGRLCK